MGGGRVVWVAERFDNGLLHPLSSTSEEWQSILSVHKTGTDPSMCRSNSCWSIAARDRGCVQLTWFGESVNSTSVLEHVRCWTGLLYNVVCLFFCCCKSKIMKVPPRPLTLSFMWEVFAHMQGWGAGAGCLWLLVAGAAWKKGQEPEPLKNLPAPQPYAYASSTYINWAVALAVVLADMLVTTVLLAWLLSAVFDPKGVCPRPFSSTEGDIIVLILQYKEKNSWNNSNMVLLTMSSFVAWYKRGSTNQSLCLNSNRLCLAKLHQYTLLWWQVKDKEKYLKSKCLTLSYVKTSNTT